jgi:hypothetical protein
MGTWSLHSSIRFYDAKLTTNIHQEWYINSPTILDGGWRAASRPGRFIPGKRAPDTHSTRGWVGPRAGPDAVEYRQYRILVCGAHNFLNAFLLSSPPLILGLFYCSHTSTVSKLVSYGGHRTALHTSIAAVSPS